MNIDETAKVLAKIQLGDNRQITSLVIQEWHDTIGDLPYTDAVEAVRMHRRDTIAYLMPAHIRANARVLQHRRERAQRIARPGLPRPEITLDRETFEAETRKWIEHYRRQRANEPIETEEATA
ncbi:coproporphyrinogen III oxidase [Leifsonia xyli subsp. cynodontis DSM 46306]|uniref:Uncharacterized protein n=1 Tax=Leifsonia xyli subsp. cynodontis DSM 46306 TaxID=1389489 RepID=U3PBW9_LEIXC|nr:hypothetical protein [Leifsonia xyli]AGW41724.1 coproporphyrinogen III oxidase [Leifsonia xyli subsp. cynodontis DSM 46306]AGW42247.1 coproporphyrinogen III oxidase [Leifsonia xyli subsp. cynodontis DSM 46306]